MSLIVRVQWADGREQMVDTGLSDDDWNVEKIMLRTYAAPDLTNWFRHSPDDPAPLPVMEKETLFRRTELRGHVIYKESK